MPSPDVLGSLTHRPPSRLGSSMGRPAAQNVTKLPKWAQDQIARLQRDLADAKAKLSVGPESNTIADPIRTDRPLGDDTRIRFILSRHDDGSAAEYIDVTLESEAQRLDIYGSGKRAALGIAIFPRSSNTAYVKLAQP